jgi:endonuclease YncB( thermonuclease family)
MISNRAIRFIFCTLLLSLLLAISGGCAVSYRVIDGDTIKLQSGESIRYLGIDTPERDEPLYAEATELNRTLLKGRTIIFTSDITDKDKYGRLLRYVFADTIFVNLELVRNGLALAYSKNKFQDNMYYKLFEWSTNEAFKNGFGIWALPFIHPKIEESPDDYYIPHGYHYLQAYMILPNSFTQFI